MGRPGASHIGNLLDRRWLAAIVLATLAPAAARAQSPQAANVEETLTLKDSLDRAYANNPKLLSASKELEIAKTHLSQARSLFYPKVDLNLDYVKFRNERLGLPPRGLGDLILSPSGDGLRTQSLYYGRLGFQQTLYAGGKLNYTYKLSQANVKRSESGFERLRREVEFETAKGFYGLVALQEKERAVEASLKEVSRLSAGSASLEVAAVKADLRKRFSELVEAENQTRFDYLQTMGVELFRKVALKGSLEPPSVSLDLETDLSWAKENRNEIKETEIQEEVDQLYISLSQSENHPVFLLGGGVEVQNNKFPLDETNWDTVLSMNIPVFNGFSTFSRIRERQFQAEQTRLKRVELEDQVERDVRSGIREYQHWQDEVKTRQQEIDFLEKTWRQNGSSALKERLNFMQWDLNERLSLIEAKYEMCLASAGLSKALGRSLEDQP